jgi:phosphopantothenate---cysteine ligase (CTP)
MLLMRILITGGPTSEPIDEVRAVTNRSTGRLAVTLFDYFSEKNHQVELLMGHGAIFRRDAARFFGTNDQLKALLASVRDRSSVDLVLHAAALSDFGIDQVYLDGNPTVVRKIPSEAKDIQLRLGKREKLISHLRGLFPHATIVGWKLEMDGDQESVLRKAGSQIIEHQTDACVVNGAAFGSGFGLVAKEGLIESVSTGVELASILLRFAATRRAQP